jgi:hypothetical protein
LNRSHQAAPSDARLARDAAPQLPHGSFAIRGRPEDQPNAPLGTYPVNDGDTVILAASTQLGMANDQSGVDLNPQ